MRLKARRESWIAVVTAVAIIFWSRCVSAQDWRSVTEDDPVLQDVELFGHEADKRIAILIEAGAVAPAQTLLRLGMEADIVLDIQDGDAEFLYLPDDESGIKRVKQVSYRSDTVRLPELLVGARGRDSTLVILVNGVAIGDPLRVADLKQGLIEDLWMVMETTAPAILRLNQKAGYVLADLKKLTAEKLQEDVDRIRRRQEEGKTRRQYFESRESTGSSGKSTTGSSNIETGSFVVRS